MSKFTGQSQQSLPKNSRKSKQTNFFIASWGLTVDYSSPSRNIIISFGNVGSGVLLSGKLKPWLLVFLLFYLSLRCLALNFAYHDAQASATSSKKYSTTILLITPKSKHSIPYISITRLKLTNQNTLNTKMPFPQPDHIIYQYMYKDIENNFIIDLTPLA
jgi:hypothetical protein